MKEEYRDANTAYRGTARPHANDLLQRYFEDPAALPGRTGELKGDKIRRPIVIITSQSNVRCLSSPMKQTFLRETEKVIRAGM